MIDLVIHAKSANLRSSVSCTAECIRSPHGQDPAHEKDQQQQNERVDSKARTVVLADIEQDAGCGNKEEVPEHEQDQAIHRLIEVGSLAPQVNGSSDQNKQKAQS